MSGRTETIDSGEFVEARELPLLLQELLASGRRNSTLDRYDIVYVVGPDGQVFHHARLVRERLTDHSYTFNVVLDAAPGQMQPSRSESPGTDTRLAAVSLFDLEQRMKNRAARLGRLLDIKGMLPFVVAGEKRLLDEAFEEWRRRMIAEGAWMAETKP